MKSFVGYIANKIVKAIPKSQKVAPTIKSVKPTKDIKGSVKRVYRQEESKRIDKTVASKKKMETGKKMMREGQKELRRQIDTRTAFKFKGGKTGEKTFAIKPGENVKEKFKGLIEENKPTKKFKTGKQLEAEKKAKGGRIGYRAGTPKKQTNVQKIKKTFGKGLGMQSVIYGLDKNPKITAADPKAKFIAANKKKKKI